MLLLLVALTSAHAITEDHAGAYGSIGGGLAITEAPARPAPGWFAAGGFWWGQYDNAYAIGKFTGLGVAAHQTLGPSGLRTAPMLEVRRGFDLIVTQVHGFVSGGPLLTTSAEGTTVGATARAGLGARYRFHRFWGVSLRLEGGADFSSGPVAGVGSALVTFDVSRPFSSVE